MYIISYEEPITKERRYVIELLVESKNGYVSMLSSSGELNKAMHFRDELIAHGVRAIYKYFYDKENRLHLIVERL